MPKKDSSPSTRRTTTLNERARVVTAPPGARALGIAGINPADLVREIRKGFPFESLARLATLIALPREKLAHFVGIAPRTLSRREAEGRLSPEESDRVLRASAIFEMAVGLFEGDIAAARHWLLSPQVALGGEVPMEFAATGVGAREVENVIGRLEHGVFT